MSSLKHVAFPMFVQVSDCCFRSILPGGDALLTSLNVLRLAATLTKHDKCSCILWTNFGDALRASLTCKFIHGMMPIHDIQHVMGQQRKPKLAFMTAMRNDFPLTPEQGDLELYFIYSRGSHSACGDNHGQVLPTPTLDPNLKWGPETFQLAVAHADEAVAQLLLAHPFARNGNGPASWLIPISCPLKRAVQLVCPNCKLPGDSSSS